MGTRYAVVLALPIDNALRDKLSELIEAELAVINRAMSTYDARSELSEFNRRQDLGWVPASPGLLEVLESASRISASTQGAFDVTVGPLVDLWGAERKASLFEKVFGHRVRFSWRTPGPPAALPPGSSQASSAALPAWRHIHPGSRRVRRLPSGE